VTRHVKEMVINKLKNNVNIQL